MNKVLVLLPALLFAQEAIKFDILKARELLLKEAAPVEEEAAAPAAVPDKPAAVPAEPAVVPAEQAVYAAAPAAQAQSVSYEDFLDALEELARGMLPEKEKLDAQKAAAEAEAAEPKDEFEKQADFERRVADFERAKRQRVADLEDEFRVSTKSFADKIKNGLASKDDFQPDWGGMLRKDAASVDEYRERAVKFDEKILRMKARVGLIGDLLGKLGFADSDLKVLMANFDAKNFVYFSRLERAVEVMQDFVVQEHSRVVSSERKRVEMSLGSYNPEREEFEFSMNDSLSESVPFDFSGKMKISPELARETNRQTDDFTASVDYINFPLVAGELKVFAGAKKARVFYKERELPASGSFRRVQRLGDVAGYGEWVARSDSILNGSLVPRNLDEGYAMAKGAKVASGIASSGGEGFWSRSNLRVAAFAVSALCFGVGLAQDGAVSSNSKRMDKRYAEALQAQGTLEYADKYRAFKRSADDVRFSEGLRNGFYVGAGLFGVAGAVLFFF